MSTKNRNSLFDNPMINSAREALTPEQKKRYETIGKEMYGNIDFEKSKILNNLPPPMQEALMYIEEGLKSGLHPNDIEEDERALLEEAYGKEWYKRYGYEESDCKFSVKS